MIVLSIIVLVLSILLVQSLHITSSWPPDRHRLLSRNTFVSSILIASGAGALLPKAAIASLSDVTVRLESSNDRVGLELMDVTIGSPPKPTVAIKRVISSSNKNLQPGMILLDSSSAAEVQQRIRQGPYPIDLTFRNLAAVGDAIADDGKPLVTAQDALDLARRNSGQIPTTETTPEYSITVLKAPDSSCKMQSRRNDILEFNYEARIGDANGIIYDSSATRGTGQPYQSVLGSGDILPGVDQGLYDMCPGEVRTLQIPPVLAYGQRGNKLFRIPPNSSLFWNVELVSVNSVRQGDSTTREELEGRE